MKELINFYLLQMEFSPDYAMAILLIALAVPLAFIFPSLPNSRNSNSIHLFSALPSILICWLFLGSIAGMLELLASSLVTYVICWLGKEKKIMPWIAFGVIVAHLGINHTIHYFSEPLASGITFMHMFSAMKSVSFAWSVHDGQQDPQKLDSTQLESRIEEFPKLIPFLGYCFFFPSFLTGPTFTFRTYDKFTSHDLFLQDTIKSDEKLISLPPGRIRSTLIRFSAGLFFLIIYTYYSPRITYYEMLEPDFLQSSFPHRFIYFNLVGIIARMRFHAFWYMVESSYIASGMGYDPIAGNYDASANVRIMSTELAPSFKIFFDNWNMGTNKWLRECIYKRFTKAGERPGLVAVQITFIISALWHGIDPGYLITFILAGFCTDLGRSFRKSLRPFFLPPKLDSSTSQLINILSSSNQLPLAPPTISKVIYDLIGMIAVQAGNNFIMVPFMTLDVPFSLEIWSTVHYYALPCIFIPFLLLKFGGSAYLQKLIRVRDERTVRIEVEGVEKVDNYGLLKDLKKLN